MAGFGASVMSTPYTECSLIPPMGKTVDNSVDNVKNSLQLHRFISRPFPAANSRAMHTGAYNRANYPQISVDKMVTDLPGKCNK